MVTDKRGKQVLMKKYGSGVGAPNSSSSTGNSTNNTLRMNTTNSKGNRVVT